MVAALVWAATPSANAVHGSWTLNNNGTWTNTANWLSGQIADGINDSAIWNFNSSGSRTVTVDAGRVISDIVLTDSSGTTTWTFSGGPLVLANDTGVKPQIRPTASVPTVTMNLEIQGVHGFRKEQASVAVLSVSNSWTGDTEINRGTLRLGHANAIPSGAGRGNVIMSTNVGNIPALDIGSVSPTINGLLATNHPDIATSAKVTSSAGAGTSTLSIGGNDANGTFYGVIENGASRTIALTKVGTGTLELGAGNTYTGATTISAGELRLTGLGSISSSTTVNLAGGASLDVSGVSFPPYTIPAFKTLNGTSGTSSIKGDLTVDFDALLTVTYLAGTPTIEAASGTLNFVQNNVTVNAVNPLFDGNYKLISKSGGTVSGSFGSVTVIGAGIAGGGSPSLSIVGGELFLEITGGVTALEWGSGNGTWAVGVAGWNSGGGTVFANGNATLLTDTFATGDPTITLNSTVLPQGVIANTTRHYTIQGNGDIGGSAHLSKLGTGTLTLNVANTYSGGTTLAAGKLNVNNASALGSASGTLTLEGGTLDNSSGGPITTVNHPQAWNGNFAFAGSNDLDLGAGAVTLSATRTVTVNASTLTVGGDLSGGGIVKNGAGTLALNGSLSSGGVTLNAGTLSLGGNNTFTGGVVINDGELIVDNAGGLNSATPNTVTFETDTDVKTLSLNGNSVTIRDLAMGIIGSQQTTVRNNSATTDVTLTVNVPGAAKIYAGFIADGGSKALALTKTGTGTFQFGGGNAGLGTYSGDTTISQGTVRMGANNVFPHGLNKGDMIISTGATLDILDRTLLTVNGLFGDGKVDSSDKGGGTGIITFTVGDGDASGDFSGVIQNVPAPSQTAGTISLVKTGTGTQTLSGVNTYSGTTAVNGGTLLVNTPGSLPATTVSVNNNGTLGGDGTVNGAVIVNSGGHIAPGASAGTLTLNGGLDLSAGGTYDWELLEDTTANAGTDYDQLYLGGSSLNVNGGTLRIQLGVNVDVNDPFWTTSQEWNIVTSSSLSGTPDFAAIQVVGGSPAGAFSTSHDGSNLKLTFTPGGGPPVVQPQITTLTGAGTVNVTVNYTNTLLGTNYTLQYKTNLSETNWYDVGTAPAGGTSASQTDNAATTPQRYYRVLYVIP